jgi:uncharacterized Zn-finger protein
VHCIALYSTYNLIFFCHFIKVNDLIFIVNMISKQKCVCITCGRGFTRRTSGNRHNLNLHSGMSIIVESSLYYIGILQGKYPNPNPATAVRRRLGPLSDLKLS